jgi:hypothetical protein
MNMEPTTNGAVPASREITTGRMQTSGAGSKVTGVLALSLRRLATELHGRKDSATSKFSFTAETGGGDKVEGFAVRIGHPKAILGNVWKGGDGKYHLALDFPAWAKDAIPQVGEVEAQVTQSKGATQQQTSDIASKAATGQTTRIRVKGKELDEILDILRHVASKIVGGGLDDQESVASEGYPFIGVDSADGSYLAESVSVHFDFNGDGAGAYLGVRTSYGGGSAVVEVVGPIPTLRGTPIEKIKLAENWVPVAKTVAECRGDALEKIGIFLREEGFEAIVEHGIIKASLTEKLR